MGADVTTSLLRVSIEDRLCDVPANDTLLRALQHLEVDLYACRLCWNGDCDNCRFAFVDDQTGATLTTKGCLTNVTAGMRIVCLPRHAVWPDGTAGREPDS